MSARRHLRRSGKDPDEIANLVDYLGADGVPEDEARRLARMEHVALDYIIAQSQLLAVQAGQYGETFAGAQLDEFIRRLEHGDPASTVEELRELFKREAGGKDVAAYEATLEALKTEGVRAEREAVRLARLPHITEGYICGHALALDFELGLTRISERPDPSWTAELVRRIERGEPDRNDELFGTDEFETWLNRLGGMCDSETSQGIAISTHDWPTRPAKQDQPLFTQQLALLGAGPPVCTNRNKNPETAVSLGGPAVSGQAQLQPKLKPKLHARG